MTLDDLAAWLRVGRKDNLKTRLLKLDRDKLVLAHTSGRFFLTRKGQQYVEVNRLTQPI